MKKMFKVLYRLLLISVVLQTIAYIYINNIYLGNRQDIEGKIKVLPVSSIGSSEPAEISVKIPQYATDIKVSHDLSYAAYMLENHLEIVDIAKQKTIKTINSYFPDSKNSIKTQKNNSNITCYKWLPDKDIIMYTLSSASGHEGRIQVFTYDASTGNEHSGVSLEGNIPGGSEGVDLIISPITMVTYLKVKISDDEARLYRINLMDQIFEPISININSRAIIGYYTENLFFQNSNRELFRKNGLDPVKKLQFSNKAVPLAVVGSDGNGKDVAYIGQLDKDNKVDKILYGMIDTDPSKWAEISLKNPKSPLDVTVLSDGSVYEISRTDNSVVNLKGSAKFEFTGKFIDIMDNRVIYLEGNILKSKTISAKT